MALPDILKSRLRIPVVGAPLFIISHPALVMAQCKAGVVGSFPALNALAAYDKANPDRPSAPFAVNQIVHRSNKRLEHDLGLCVKYKVPIVISSLGAVPEVNAAIHSYGGIVLHDVINNRHANSAIRKGADGLIAVAAGAGGHAGSLSPFALVQEIRSWFDGPLLLSGAIANGNSILAAQAMGARATDAYKQMSVDSTSSDIVYSNYFTGIAGNYLKPSIANSGMDPDNLPEADPSKMDFETAQQEGAKAWKDIWGCGQGIGAIHEVAPAGQLIDRLEREYKEARQRLCAGA